MLMIQITTFKKVVILATLKEVHLLIFIFINEEYRNKLSK